MISAAQIREALALLGWTPLTLAVDDVTRALDDIGIRHLGGLQLGAIRDVLNGAGVELCADFCAPSVYLRDHLL